MINLVKFFSGDPRRDKIRPKQWIKLFESQIRSCDRSITDQSLASLLSAYLEVESLAERWWEDDLSDEVRSSFTLAKAAFVSRFERDWKRFAVEAARKKVSTNQENLVPGLKTPTSSNVATLTDRNLHDQVVPSDPDTPQTHAKKRKKTEEEEAKEIETGLRDDYRSEQHRTAEQDQPVCIKIEKIPMDLGDGPNQSEAEEREVEQRQEWEGVLPLPPTATNEPNAKGMKESHALCQKEGPWTSSQYKDAFRAKDLRREALWSDHGMAQARQSDPGRWSTKNDGRSRQFGSQRGTTPPKGPAKGWAEGEYRCPWQGCSSLHARLGDLYQHYNFKHNQTNRGFYCDLCLRFYPCQESLRDHRDRSHVGHPWKRCQKCDVKFGVEFSLDSHQHFHHHIKSKAKALGVSPKRELRRKDGPDMLHKRNLRDGGDQKEEARAKCREWERQRERKGSKKVQEMANRKGEGDIEGLNMKRSISQLRNLVDSFLEERERDARQQVSTGDEDPESRVAEERGESSFEPLTPPLPPSTFGSGKGNTSASSEIEGHRSRSASSHTGSLGQPAQTNTVTGNVTDPRPQRRIGPSNDQEGKKDPADPLPLSSSGSFSSVRDPRVKVDPRSKEAIQRIFSARLAILEAGSGGSRDPFKGSSQGQVCKESDGTRNGLWTERQRYAALDETSRGQASEVLVSKPRDFELRGGQQHEGRSVAREMVESIKETRERDENSRREECGWRDDQNERREEKGNEGEIANAKDAFRRDPGNEAGPTRGDGMVLSDGPMSDIRGVAQVWEDGENVLKRKRNSRHEERMKLLEREFCNPLARPYDLE